jgi:hypothetical protein
VNKTAVLECARKEITLQCGQVWRHVASPQNHTCVQDTTVVCTFAAVSVQIGVRLVAHTWILRLELELRWRQCKQHGFCPAVQRCLAACYRTQISTDLIIMYHLKRLYSYWKNSMKAICFSVHTPYFLSNGSFDH